MVPGRSVTRSSPSGKKTTSQGTVNFSAITVTPNISSEEETLSSWCTYTGSPRGALTFESLYAQSATKVNPQDSFNWVGLGQVYGNLVPLKLEGARSVALDAYARAMETSPFDPRPLLASAQVEIQSGNIDGARQFLARALELKGNYTPVLFLMAQLAAQQGDLDNAIRQTELARLTSPDDVGILFQLGLLYYQKKDYKNTQILLERAVAINSNYSNARYFLGLSYDKLNKKQEAIGQFEVIKSLNPGNEEVERILTNLKAGRDALSAISPPGPAPEEREAPPIEDEESASAEIQ